MDLEGTRAELAIQSALARALHEDKFALLANSELCSDLDVVNINLLLKQSRLIFVSVTHSYSQLSKLITARVSSTGLVMTGPTKVKACKSVLFTEGTPKVEIKNTCLMQLKQ